jgi:hypothetical protein
LNYEVDGQTEDIPKFCVSNCRLVRYLAGTEVLIFIQIPVMSQGHMSLPLHAAQLLITTVNCHGAKNLPPTMDDEAPAAKIITKDSKDPLHESRSLLCQRNLISLQRDILFCINNLV